MRWSLFSGVICAGAIVVLDCGCSREQPQDEVLVSVCGRELTAAEVAARANNIATLIGHKKGVTNGLDQLVTEFKKGYPAYWIEDVVLGEAARAAGVEPRTNDIVRCRKNAFRNFHTKGDRSYGELMKLEGLNRRYWDDHVRTEALRMTMARYWAEQEPTNLPSDYAEQQIRLMEQWNLKMAETNRLQFAKATNVWVQIRQGLDFRVAVSKYTEIVEERADAGEWAVVDAKFLSDEPTLLRWLKAAKTGDISPPIAADNGIVIARLDRLEQEEGFAVSRIFFRLGRVLYPASKSEIVAAAKEKYAKDLFKRKLAELVEAAQVNFNKTDKEKIK